VAVVCRRSWKRTWRGRGFAKRRMLQRGQRPGSLPGASFE
jgi:hypothetical protein